jgi:5-methylcytosine-specific restriction enzyme B
MDFAVLQKVLPKLHGTRQELEAVLWELLHFCVDGEPIAAQERSHVLGRWSTRDGLLHRPPAAEAPDAAIVQLPRTGAKVWRMIRRLEQQGFTSFVE